MTNQPIWYSTGFKELKKIVKRELKLSRTEFLYEVEEVAVNSEDPLISDILEAKTRAHLRKIVKWKKALEVF